MSLYGYYLPIEKHKDKIIEVVEKSKICVIKGPTGCGKSTYIPYLLSSEGSRIAIVEPRRMAVMSLYKTLSEVIANVGYKMRFSKHGLKNARVVIYTDGSFLNEMDKYEFDYVIIDEVHERSIRTDIILGLIRSMIGRMSGKIILMSATVDVKKICRYFDANVLEISGTPHPVRTEYLQESTSDYLVEAYCRIKKIVSGCHGIEDVNGRDILVFLPGEEDINELCLMLRRIPVVKVYKVFSALGDNEQSKIYEESKLIKVILSTNICEVSLTIPGVGYVIDTGLVKVKIYDAMNYFGIQAISKESANQRLGRCNRTGPGVCYRLYTESAYEEMPNQQTPEICRSDLSQVVLQLLSHGKNPLTFEFLDYPTCANIVNAIKFLVAKRCIEVDGIGNEDVSRIKMKVTGYGRTVLRHPFDTHLAHFYQQTIESGVGYFGSIVVSLAGQEGYSFLKCKEIECKSDLEFLIKLFEGYIDSEDRKQYCVKHGVSMKCMEVARQTFGSLRRCKDGDIEMVESVFSRAYQHNACERVGDGSYRHVNSGEIVWIHPDSRFFKRRDRFIVFVDVFYTSKAYARIVGKYFSNNLSAINIDSNRSA
ncbi:HrpA-like helicase [Ordospora colligata]|uniref:HrpA-like helicase n=1 Tax=Ordospora colligata OC4 TaxID=1354746 RepID=A0A0B2UKV6_9MICR|nr:HrpA-like helicase [Ordospora colligata OC4]KHN69874.1 HrpA-like helicase [Ordospora colligata OC4]TBU16044.1 HrpA-like helicase [Ordospora colligata]TBU16257.1 HrpA-like helicase [Ordospora colligata]TBU18961.1 HrpA-like helicase [Ordospora colligata]